MKALTLHQPWASLVAIGAKRIETRSWSTSYRGPLAIHAAQKLPANWSPFSAEPFRSVLESITGLNEYSAPDLTELPRGCVLATCRLVDVVQIADLMSGALVGCVVVDDWGGVRVCEPGKRSDRFVARMVGAESEAAFGDYTPGRFAWILEDVTPLEVPIAAKGSLSLWEWDGAEVPA